MKYLAILAGLFAFSTPNLGFAQQLRSQPEAIKPAETLPHGAGGGQMFRPKEVQPHGAGGGQLYRPQSDPSTPHGAGGGQLLHSVAENQPSGEVYSTTEPTRSIAVSADQVAGMEQSAEITSVNMATDSNQCKAILNLAALVESAIDDENAQDQISNCEAYLSKSEDGYEIE